MYTAGTSALSLSVSCPWRRSSPGSSGMFAIHTKETGLSVSGVSAQTCCGPPAARLTESSADPNSKGSTSGWSRPRADMSAAELQGLQQVSLIRQKVMSARGGGVGGLLLLLPFEEKMRQIGRNSCGDLKKARR